MKYKLFPAPFFKHFTQPSLPPITKLESLHGVSRGELHPHPYPSSPPPKKQKNGQIPLWLAPHMITSKLPLSLNLYSLSNPINMTTMIRQHTTFHLLLDPPGKPDHRVFHCPTANEQRWTTREE